MDFLLLAGGRSSDRRCDEWAGHLAQGPTEEWHFIIMQPSYFSAKMKNENRLRPDVAPGDYTALLVGFGVKRCKNDIFASTSTSRVVGI